MSPTMVKWLIVSAVFVPYLTVSVIFFFNMVQTCGTASLVLAAMVWIPGSIFPYLAASRLLQDFKFVNDSDQALCALLAFLLWVLFMVVEYFTIVSFLGGACDVSVVISLVAWVGGAVLAAIISEGIPSVFRD